MNDDICLKLSNFSLSNGKEELIRDGNIEIKKGQLVLLFGSNGTGKTTLFKCLCKRVDKDKRNEKEYGLRTKEKIVFDGKAYEPGHFKAIGDQIGYAEQRMDLNFSNMFIRCLDYCLEFTEPYRNFLEREKKRDYNPRKYLKSLFNSFSKKGYENLKDRRLFNMSGGQRQAVNLIRCLGRKDAPLYLIDEPTNTLDGDMINNFLDVLESIRKENPSSSFFIITHWAVFNNPDKVYGITKGKEKTIVEYSLDSYHKNKTKVLTSESLLDADEGLLVG